MKKAITIDLNRLRELLKEFIAERGGDDVLQQLYLSEFLIWIQQKETHEARHTDRVSNVLSILKPRRAGDC